MLRSYPIVISHLPIMSWPPKDVDHLLVTAAQMAAMEDAVFASGLPRAALMEKVGLAMAARILSRPNMLEHGVHVLIGPGHNGGDGLVVARELHQAGISVSLWRPLPLQRSLTQKYWSHAHWLGLPEREPDPSDIRLWIEALFGLGQSRPLPAAISSMLEEREYSCPGRLVSLDVPAGVDSDSGCLLGVGGATATLTLTAGLVKQGLIQDQALTRVGELERIDVGLPQQLLDNLPDEVILALSSVDLRNLPVPSPPREAMKYKRGRLLTIVGSLRYGGAARLALEGGLASGVGSVRALLPKLIASSLWATLPEVVLEDVLPCDENGCLELREALLVIAESRMDTLLIGPGLGLSEEPLTSLTEVLAEFTGLLLLDADALNRLAAIPGHCSWLKQRNGPTWLTPHRDEFNRLFPDLRDLEPATAARAAAIASGSCILLKGAHSLVASPSGSLIQLSQTAPWGARTGLGDVLAGFAAGWGALTLAAGKQCDFSVLAAAALLHAEAVRTCRTGSTATIVASRIAIMICALQQANNEASC